MIPGKTKVGLVPGLGGACLLRRVRGPRAVVAIGHVLDDPCRRAGRRASGAEVPVVLRAPPRVARWAHSARSSIPACRYCTGRIWQERERQLYRSLRGTSIRIEADGTLVLPCLAGESAGGLCWRSGNWTRPPAGRRSNGQSSLLPISIARVSPAAVAMAENVMVDLDTVRAHWFDFETTHDPSRPNSLRRRRADDVRALLATCLVGTSSSGNASRTLRTDPGCLRRRRSDSPPGFELYLGRAAPAAVPPRAGRIVASVLPENRPVTSRALWRIGAIPSRRCKELTRRVSGFGCRRLGASSHGP